MTRRKPDEPPLSPTENNKYQSSLGIARFIADAFGCSIATVTLQLSTHKKDPYARHMQALKRLARNPKNTFDLGVQHAHKGSSHAQIFSPLHLKVWSDSDLASCLDARYSQTGAAFSFAADLIYWNSFRQHAHALSRAEEDFIAASRAGRGLKLLRQLDRQWKIPPLPASSTTIPFYLSLDTNSSSPLTINIDKKAAISMANSSTPTKRSYHVDLHHHFLVSEVEAGRIKLSYILAHLQKADLLTKVLTS